MMMSIYGSLPYDPTGDIARQEIAAKGMFNYLKARIEAENLNPSYNDAMRAKLLNEVAASCCNVYQRRELVELLNFSLDDEDDY